MHISEELRSVNARIKKENSVTALKMLVSVKQQLELAWAATRKSRSKVYFFEERWNKVRRKANIMTLCHKCRKDFENAGAYCLRRVDLEQEIKESCTYCSQRMGWDYEITPNGEEECR
jgi:hypothetical protein